VYEADNFILSKVSVFVGKGYAGGDMFKFNVIAPSGNKVNNFAYMLVHSISSLWHNRLEHVNYKRLKEMSRLELTPDMDENIEKCKTCMLIKITRSSFPNVQGMTKLLELIYDDLGDFIALLLLEERNIVSHSLMISQDIAKCIFYLLKVKH